MSYKNRCPVLVKSSFSEKKCKKEYQSWAVSHWVKSTQILLVWLFWLRVVKSITLGRRFYFEMQWITVLS